MKYASTFFDGTTERIVVVLPLEIVSAFDPTNPPQPNTYGVDDDVQLGWIKNNLGKFVPPINNF
jgi:hypothetical protein